MQKSHKALLLVFGITLLTTLFSLVALPKPASGHERDTGYQLVISQQSATTGYGQNPFYTAVLSFPVADAPIDPVGFNFTIAGHVYPSCCGPVAYQGQASGQATWVVNGYLSTLPIGQYNLSATYFIAKTQTTIQSNTLTHTVTKGDIGSFQCLMIPNSGPFSPGQTVTLLMQIADSSIDPQSLTFNVSFSGPMSVSYTNLTPDSSHHLLLTVPSVPGNYNLQCQFNGTSLYNVSQYQATPFIVTLGHQPGPFKVYSNPSTIVPGKPATLYIIVPTTPGLPTPTGTLMLTCFQSYTNRIPLDQAGSINVVTTFPASCVNKPDPFGMLYSGDGTYAQASYILYLSNAPIPVTAPPATPVTVNPGKGSASATATPVRGATATPTTIAATTVPGALTPTPTALDLAVGGAANTTPTTVTPDGKTGGGNLWLVAILLLIALGGGGATGFWYLRRRAQPAGVGVPVSSMPTTPFSELTEPLQPPLDGDITQS